MLSTSTPSMRMPLKRHSSNEAPARLPLLRLKPDMFTLVMRQPDMLASSNMAPAKFTFAKRLPAKAMSLKCEPEKSAFEASSRSMTVWSFMLPSTSGRPGRHGHRLARQDAALELGTEMADEA